MAVVLLCWVLGEFGAGMILRIRINFSGPQMLAFPMIFADFENFQDFCNARDRAHVHTASRTAGTLFLEGFSLIVHADSVVFSISRRSRANDKMVFLLLY